MGKHSASRPVLALVFCTTINVLVGATSIVPFFSDASCNDSLFTGENQSGGVQRHMPTNIARCEQCKAGSSGLMLCRCFQELTLLLQSHGADNI